MDDRDEVRDAFDRLRESVEPTVDTEAHLSGLHGVRSWSRVRSGRGPRIAAVAAAVILGVGLAAVALWPTGDSTTIDAADAPSSPTGAPTGPDEARCGDGAYVYLALDADDAQVESVRARIEQLGGAQEIQYLDRDATLDEFSRVFADQPDFIEAISAEELPTSFRFQLLDPWTTAEIESIEAHPDVLRVEFSRGSCGQSEAPATPPDDASTTTSTQLGTKIGEGMVPVAPLDDSTVAGFVSSADFGAEVTEFRLVPVVDALGEQIAWWASGVGWLSFDEVAEPGFDLQQRVSESNAGSGERSPARP